MRLTHGCTVELDNGVRGVISRSRNTATSDPYYFFLKGDRGIYWYSDDGLREKESYPKIVKVLSTAPTATDRKKTASDGGSSEYFKLPDHATELRHLMSFKSMSKSRADIFKACYRLGEKEGTSVDYDLKKMKFFIEDLIEMRGRGEHL